MLFLAYHMCHTVIAKPLYRDASTELFSVPGDTSWISKNHAAFVDPSWYGAAGRLQDTVECGMRQEPGAPSDRLPKSLPWKAWSHGGWMISPVHTSGLVVPRPGFSHHSSKTISFTPFIHLVRNGKNGMKKNKDLVLPSGRLGGNWEK